jgi:hypothetical protein
MLNNFQVEIVRQFEIQRATIDNLIADYLIDERDCLIQVNDKDDSGDSSVELLEDHYFQANADTAAGLIDDLEDYSGQEPDLTSFFF